jgi:cobalt/nickel transport system ATP-binding protein
MAEPVFSLEQVCFRYHEVTALESLDLRIEEGSRTALLGANGSGKSTLLRILDALYFPTAGSVRFRGLLLDARTFESDEFSFDFRRRVGLVFQSPDVQLFNPTVFDELAFGPLQLRWSRREIVERVETVMERFEIAHLRDRPPHRLSGGEKKRVAIASVLVLDPEVLLLDEPTAALDPRSESQILSLLASLGDGKRTIVIATHDLNLALDLADRCVLLDRGKLAAEGDPREIVRDTELLGRVNLIHEHLHRHASGIVHSHPHRHPHEH